jgi:hypothetical protein
MHPDLIRVLAEQHVRDMQARAETGLRARLARQARQARKARRHSRHAPDPLATVRVPDYVDGTFRTDARTADGARLDEGAPSAGPAERPAA